MCVKVKAGENLWARPVEFYFHDVLLTSLTSGMLKTGFAKCVCRIFSCGKDQRSAKNVRYAKSANLTKTPTKIYSPDQFCRLCQCNIAIVGRGKCNIFSGKSSDGLARRLSIVLDAPVEKEDSVSSNVCYKCKREMEKYEGYMKALNVDLKAF